MTDIHHGVDKPPKQGSAAGRLMDGFGAFCREMAPDAVVDLGDRILDLDRETDLHLEREAADMFSPIDAPIHHICGNHDRAFLSTADNAEILGQPMENEAIDLGGWTLVLWRADAEYHRAGGFSLPASDLDWLAGVIGSATQPLLVCSHVPVSGHSQISNHYFHNAPAAATYPEADQARAVLAEAKVPVVCVAGHVHWNSLTIVDGQPHLTLQSLTETFTTAPDPAGAFAVLDLADDVVWTVHGRDAFHTRLPAQQSARGWLAPRPPRRPS